MHAPTHRLLLTCITRKRILQNNLVNDVSLHYALTCKMKVELLHENSTIRVSWRHTDIQFSESYNTKALEIKKKLFLFFFSLSFFYKSVFTVVFTHCNAILNSISFLQTIKKAMVPFFEPSPLVRFEMTFIILPASASILLSMRAPIFD